MLSADLLDLREMHQAGDISSIDGTNSLEYKALTKQFYKRESVSEPVEEDYCPDKE